jgi:hypothetical protein
MFCSRLLLDDEGAMCNDCIYGPNLDATELRLEEETSPTDNLMAVHNSAIFVPPPQPPLERRNCQIHNEMPLTPKASSTRCVTPQQPFKSSSLSLIEREDLVDIAETLDFDLNDDIKRIPLQRTETIRAPLRLRLNEDLYRFISKGSEVIKSWITDSVITNYVYDDKLDAIVKIDDTIPDGPDRRLLIPGCILID